MAKNYYELQGLMEIMKELFKLPRKNTKIFLFVIISTLIPYSLLILANIYSLIPISNRLSMAVFPLLTMDPTSPEYLEQISKIQEESMLLLLVQIIFLLIMSIISLISLVAAIYVSAMSYLGRDLTIKDLCLKIKKIWIRPLITSFYFSLINTGFFILIIPICVLVAVARRGSIFVVGVGSVLILLAICFGIYFALVWMVSLVISVMEDCYGLEALGKAGKLVKGRKVVGLLLSFGLMIFSGAIFFVSAINGYQEKATIRFLIMFVMLTAGILVKVLSMMVYTVFYFERKQSHGEQVEVEEDMGYTKVSTIPLVEAAIP